MQKDPIEEIKEDLTALKTDIAVMNLNISKQGEVLDKLSEAFAKLSIFVEKTNENDKKISALFSKLDNIYNNGTKNCPVQQKAIKYLEDDIIKTNKRIDEIQKALISVVIAIVLQFVGLIIYLIERHII